MEAMGAPVGASVGKAMESSCTKVEKIPSVAKIPASSSCALKLSSVAAHSSSATASSVLSSASPANLAKVCADPLPTLL
jgi:hypothetical protein